MKKSLIYISACFFFITQFISCDLTSDYDQYKIGEFRFYIDSIYNITQSSATVKATLFTTKVEKNITGLRINYGKKEDRYSVKDTLSQSFVRKEGTVTLEITGLEPNTEYYVTPWIELAYGTDPYISYVTAVSSPFPEVFFTTLGD